MGCTHDLGLPSFCHSISVQPNERKEKPVHGPWFPNSPSPRKENATLSSKSHTGINQPQPPSHGSLAVSVAAPGLAEGSWGHNLYLSQQVSIQIPSRNQPWLYNFSKTSSLLWPRWSYKIKGPSTCKPLKGDALAPSSKKKLLLCKPVWPGGRKIKNFHDLGKTLRPPGASSFAELSFWPPLGSYTSLAHWFSYFL